MNLLNRSFFTGLLIASSLLPGSKTAHAESQNSSSAQNRIRVNVSDNVTHGTILSYSDSAGVRIEYFRQLVGPFELGASALDVFFASGANLYSLNLEPALVYDLDAFHLYGGPLLGAILRREDTGGVQFNTSSLGLGGFAGVDYRVYGGLLVNASLQYIGASDQSGLSIFSMGGGIGYEF